VDYKTPEMTLNGGDELFDGNGAVVVDVWFHKLRTCSVRGHREFPVGEDPISFGVEVLWNTRRWIVSAGNLV
jgi:hypothetical protein